MKRMWNELVYCWFKYVILIKIKNGYKFKIFVVCFSVYIFVIINLIINKLVYVVNFVLFVSFIKKKYIKY